MKKVLLAGVALIVLTGVANAAPIATGSELSVSGSDAFTATASTFTINFSNPANLGGDSGSFQTVFGPIPPAVNGVVTMIPTLTQTSSNFKLYSATVGANTTDLIGGAIQSFVFSPATATNPLSSLEVKGTGTLDLTGFDATSGFFDLTTQTSATTGLSTANVTFSETSVAVSGVPEPSSLGMLLAPLLLLGGLVGWRRK